MPDPTGFVSYPPILRRGDSWKLAVLVASTGNINLSSLPSAIDGVTLTGQSVTDGILTRGDRFLAKDQTDPTENGLWEFVGAGEAAVRAFDMDQDGTTSVTAEEIAGAFVFVMDGTTNGQTLWHTVNAPGDILGTDDIVWDQFTGGGGAASLGWYNVQDYGAVGDGTTDDTTAITNTFDAADAGSGGGIIYFPPTSSYYKITSRIERTGAYKYHLLGGATRYGPSRVHQATSNTGAFRFAPPAGTPFDDRILAPVVEYLTVSGAGSASSGRGLDFTNDGHVKNCFVYGFYDGIYLAGSSFYSHILHTTVTDCDHSGISGVGTNNILIDGCRLTGLFSPGGTPVGTLVNGILISSASAIRIVNCSIEYFTQYGISIDGTNAAVIEGNYFETQQSTTGFAHLWIGGTAHTYATWVTGNYFQGDGISGFNAIKLGNAHDWHVHANRFGVNAAIGIVNAASDTGFMWGNTNSPAGTFTLPSDTITSPGATYASPSLSFSTAAAAGSATTGVRSDATLALFDTTAPVTQASGDAAATGSAGKAARRDHRHGMPTLVSALDDLSDVTITSPATADRLRYDGSAWVNSALIWRPLTTYDPTSGLWVPLVDGDGNAIMAEA